MSDRHADCRASPRLVVRARERTDTWGTLQALRCPGCGQRWSE